MEADLFLNIWQQLIWPIIRIITFVTLGLVVANFIESLNWTHKLAVIARPLIRLGHLSPITGASFSMAFFSGVASNTMLSEAYDTEKITKRELVLANLFNSLPRFFLHLPTVFFMTLPFIGGGGSALCRHYLQRSTSADALDCLAGAYLFTDTGAGRDSPGGAREDNH